MFDDVTAGKAEGYTCETSMAELYYKTCEKLGREVAELRHASIRHSKISILTIDEKLTRIAGILKCIYRGKLSLADTYIAAATKIVEGVLITTDTRLAELKPVQIRLLPIP
jgi:predicted nucleic acid-binding protein